MNDNKEGNKSYFLVDYENVNRDGLNGVEHLSERDEVVIYYSEAAETLSFGLHKRINESKAHFDYRKVQMPIKNAVDCRILFDLEKLLAVDKKAEYVIVSKDSDFDSAIEMFSSNNYHVKKMSKIGKRTETIKKAPSKTNQREAQIRSFFGQHFRDKKYKKHKDEIIQAVLKAKSKQQVNNNLMKIYNAGNIVREIYKKLKPLIKDLPGK